MSAADFIHLTLEDGSRIFVATEHILAIQETLSGAFVRLPGGEQGGVNVQEGAEKIVEAVGGGAMIPKPAKPGPMLA